MTDRSAFWLELDRLLDAGFTGQIVMHANLGNVVKYDVSQTKRPPNGRELETKGYTPIGAPHLPIAPKGGTGGSRG